MKRYYRVTHIHGNQLGLRSMHPEHSEWDPITITVPKDREVLNTLRVNNCVSISSEPGKLGELKRVSYLEVTREVTLKTIVALHTLTDAAIRSDTVPKDIVPKSGGLGRKKV